MSSSMSLQLRNNSNFHEICCILRISSEKMVMHALKIISATIQQQIPNAHMTAKQ
jgi:hypothetical protein